MHDILIGIVQFGMIVLALFGFYAVLQVLAVIREERELRRQPVTHWEPDLEYSFREEGDASRVGPNPEEGKP